MTELPLRRHTEMIAAAVELAGARVVDVGCGDGVLAAWMAKRGAEVIGIETDPGALVRARATLGPERALDGRGQELPFPGQSLDLVLYFNSLHHLPADELDAAIAEAARVLVGGGALLVVEPLAAGDHFELLRPVDDETTARAAALRALQAAPRHGFAPVERNLYRTFVRYPSAAAAIDSLIKADPRRAEACERERATLERLFAELGEPDPEGGRRFEQPFRLDRLQLRA
jgi:SAM-dependent methyltransferase